MRGRFDTKLLPEGLRATGYSADGAILAIDAEVTGAKVICPGCGQRSSRRHGRYVRHLKDFPAHGRAVQVRLSVQRFRCVEANCATKTFSEQVPDCLACRYGRRTGRFQDLVAYLGRAMGGRPAQALGRRLRFGLSKDTFLRGAASGVRTVGCEPRVVGLDDWAWRKGQRYGTLICDLERRAVIDLLPDREPATVAAWLRQHPQIEVVARDRNGGYRQAISEALPDATQVADRWHLLQNASDAFLAAVRRAMPTIRRTACSAALDPGILTAAERLQFEGFQRRQQTNVMIQRMGSEGVPIKRIVRITGLSRGLIRRVLRGEREDVFRLRQSSLTPWFPLLEKHWLDGCRNGAELWRRLRSNGFQGSLRVVGEWATRQRRAEAAIPHGSGNCPPSRKIARMMSSGRHHLSKTDSIFVTQVEHALPQLAQDRRLLDAFTSMVRNGEEDGLADWLDQAKTSGLAAFSRGLSADLDAVAAALREPWSNGQTEGQINRLKMLKRQMYGAAGIDLLLARLQHSA